MGCVIYEEDTKENIMSRSKYKNLIIVGNGFDCWQNIPTSYEEFRLYYAEHIDAVATELGYSFYTIDDKSGNKKKITSVELIYGNPLAPDNLESEFFWNLEARLDKLDDQLINLYFGREDEGRKALNKAVDEAVNLLRRLFCDWVSTFNIEPMDSGFHFSEDCFVINFNYTDTVEKRFGLSADQVFHIHGSANDADSILVGHATHPEEPFRELAERNFIKSLDPSKGLPRIDGLYAIEQALYKTDKHTMDNIDRLCVAFMERNVHVEDFENIYVLGHSMAQADIDYFKFLDSVTRCGCDYDRISPAGHIDMDMLWLISNSGELGEALLMRMIRLNIEYAMHHRNRIVTNAEELFPELKEVDEMLGAGYSYSPKDAEEAVKQRFWFEQARRTQEVLNKLEERYHVPIPDGCHSILGYMDYVNYGHDQRKRNAQWHISYYSKEDKKRIEGVMKSLNLKRYKLYSSINECIKEFSVG